MSRSKQLKEIYGTYWNWVWDIPLPGSFTYKRSKFFLKRNRPRVLTYTTLFALVVFLYGAEGSIWGLTTFLIPLLILYMWYRNWKGQTI